MLTDFQKSVENFCKLDQNGNDSFHGFFQQIQQKARELNRKIFEPKNINKKRYSDIDVYEDNRILLSNEKKDPDPDATYINASPINPQNLKFPGIVYKYISTQAPVDITLEDFWTMVWEQKTQMIVMLTREIEKGVCKCSEYWADKDPMKFGAFNVALSNLTIKEDVIIRELVVTKNGEQRKLQQLQYVSWEDHGSPDEVDSMHHFFTVYRELRKTASQDLPIVVHCSGGVGRSGSFIAMDILLDYIVEAQKKLPAFQDIDVLDLVWKLRLLRPSMVQTKLQLKFIFVFIASALKEGRYGLKKV